MLKLKLYACVLITFILLMVAGIRSDAGVYYYMDENGTYHFSNVPQSPKYSKLDIWADGGGDPNIIYLDPYYNDIIHAASSYYKVDPSLIKAMIKCESNYNRNAVSRAGAQGLMQLMPATARRFKVNDPFHPVENIWAGVYYVKYLMVLFNYDYDKVIAGYNAGEGAVKKYGGIPPYKETRGYVKKVKYYWGIYQKKSPRFQTTTRYEKRNK
jgi:Transglycosylase SLT domain/Domain of unknown function (DUF4124)